MAPRSLTLLLLVCAGCATTGPVPEGPRVLSLDVEGTDAVAEGEVKERILTSEPPWFKRAFPWLPFGEEPRLDRNAWRSDLRRITRYYQSRGFYQAEVVEDEILSREGEALPRRRTLPDAVRLQVRVHEGAPTLVEDIHLRGLEDLPTDLR